MLDSFPVSVLVGIILGFLSGLGIGGGSLLMLWLTAILRFDYPVARSINLLFFLPAAVIATIFRRKQGSLVFQTLIPAMLAGSAAAALFSFLSLGMELTLLKKLFGGLLILTGLRELLYKPK